MASIALILALVVWLYMTAWWCYATIIKRNDIADVAWGLGFVVIAITLLASQHLRDSKSLVMVLLVTMWGVRLAVHIGLRHRGKPEDGRYQAMRQKWQHQHLQSYVQVFLVQGFFMLLVTLPLSLFANRHETTLLWYNYVGLAIWAMGFLFETIGDYQLKCFLAKPQPRPRVMRTGLWRYTRHPNYFGEISLWWGMYLFLLPFGLWPIGIIGPLTITYLILGVSGIPMLEARYQGDKDYENYKKSTSAFIPFLPKK